MLKCSEQICILRMKKNEKLTFGDEIEEEVNMFEFCVVGRFSTEKNINGRAMRIKMADL